MESSDSFGTVAEHVARQFHTVYEQFAPNFDWETQLRSKTVWDEVPENNKALMIAVVKKLLIDGVIEPGPKALIKE